jgi:hypothetical protein
MSIWPSAAHQLAVSVMCKLCNRHTYTVLTTNLSSERIQTTGMHIHECFQIAEFWINELYTI